MCAQFVVVFCIYLLNAAAVCHWLAVVHLELIDALDQLGLIVGCTVMALVVVLTISRWINRRGIAKKDQAS